jgi:RNA polymerase sigma-70 factor (ECF subfamily)
MQIDKFNIKSTSGSQANQVIEIDEKKFEKLFNDYFSLLCKFSIRFVRNADIAEEIVKEQFILLWQNRNTLLIHTSLKAYLFATVKNKSIDYLRSRYAKIQSANECVTNEIQEPVDFVLTIEEKEISEVITKAIESLPEKCGIIFSMKRYGEYSNKQIAEALNISEKTVENQITIAFKKLRPILSRCFLVFAAFAFS